MFDTTLSSITGWIFGMELWTGSNCGYVHNWTKFCSGNRGYHRNSEEIVPFSMEKFIASQKRSSQSVEKTDSLPQM
jgi:hypothetical protein